MAEQHPKPNQDTETTPAPQAAAQSPSEREAEMLRKYHEQQSRLRCVGCGEGEEVL